MSGHGLTIVEILVALTVLAIGAVGLVALQLLSLRLAADTEVKARLLHVASSELELRIAGPALGGDCEALPAEELQDIDCIVQVDHCDVHPDGFSCPSPYSGGPRRITVLTTASSGEQLELSTVTSGPVP